MYCNRSILFYLLTPLFVILATGCTKGQQQSSAWDDDTSKSDPDDTDVFVDSDNPNLDSDGNIDTSSCTVEVCDGKDNDCDNQIDEEVKNDCGHCDDDACYKGEIDLITEGEKSDTVEAIQADDEENPTGKPGITLARQVSKIPYLWPANHDNHTVSKFNTETLREEGRYFSGYNPSRTAVDLDGNCWVGSRNDGVVTKIIWDKTKCVDRNGNGTIETSEPDANGTVVPINSAANPLADECVAFSAVTNPSRPSIRGMAVAPDGKIWIGYSGGGIQSIDPVTFALGTFYDGSNVPLWQVNPNTGVLEDSGKMANAGGVYGLIIDSQGRLYQSSYNRNYLPCFDTVSEQWIAIYQRSGGCSYGITVDGQDRIWTGSWPDCSGVGMFDPEKKKFYSFAVPNTANFVNLGTEQVLIVNNNGVGGHGSAKTTGVVVEPKTGDVWTSFFQQGYTGRLHVDESDYAKSTWTLIGTVHKEDNTGRLDGIGGNDLRGVGLDIEGYVWTLGLNSDRLFKIDPNTNQRHPDAPAGIPVGVGSHYTYSDFTGSAAFNFTAPQGSWTNAYAKPFACALPLSIDWEAYAPPGTAVKLRIRAVDKLGTPVGDWIPNMADYGKEYFEYPQGAANNHVDLSGEVTNFNKGHNFDLDLLMTTQNDKVRPIVHSITINWENSGTCGLI